MESASVRGAPGRGVGPATEPYLDANGHIALPEGTNLSALLDKNIVEFADALAYRYVDYSQDPDGKGVELTWDQVGTRSRAIAARLQQVTTRGDRVAILAPQGLDYVTSFFGSIQAANIAVPLFAPELPGHAERLDAVLTDAQPAVVLTTTAAGDAVQKFVRLMPREKRPRIIAVDAIPDSVGSTYAPVTLLNDEVAYLQYTSGSTRTPTGVEITHRGAGTNLLQMVLSIGLEGAADEINGVSWLPLYHDMGLMMIGFPILYGGHLTFMSPMAFVRRPLRWIQVLSDESKNCHIVSPAPNFAFDLVAQRGMPGDTPVDLSKVVLINGSEPVNLESILKFTEAFLPYGLTKTAVRPSYGMAEAALFVSSILPYTEPTAVYVDREELGRGRIVRVEPDAPNALAQVSCGEVAVSQWAAIVDPDTGAEVPDEHVGEIWLHGDNIGRGYWARPEETEYTFGNKLQSRLDTASHADGTAGRCDCGCEPAIWAATSTATCTSPAASRTWSSSTAATTTRRTSRRRSPKHPTGYGTVSSRRSRFRRESCPTARPTTPARSSSSSPSGAPERAGRIHSPSSTPSAGRCHASTPSTPTTFGSSPPVSSRARQAASWRDAHAARSTSRGR